MTTLARGPRQFEDGRPAASQICHIVVEAALLNKSCPGDNIARRRRGKAYRSELPYTSEVTPVQKQPKISISHLRHPQHVWVQWQCSQRRMFCLSRTRPASGAQMGGRGARCNVMIHDP